MTAWLLLVGFILLIVNLVFFRYQWKFSAALYIIAVVYFFLRLNKKA